MVERMGYARAFEMLVLGETFTATDAANAGFVNRIVAGPALETTAVAAALRLAQKPPEALAIARRLMRGDTSIILSRTEDEVAAFRGRLRSPEAREAFAAFFEKRPPNYRKSV